jgi:hypothetical protein
MRVNNARTRQHIFRETRNWIKRGETLERAAERRQVSAAAGIMNKKIAKKKLSSAFATFREETLSAVGYVTHSPVHWVCVLRRRAAASRICRYRARALSEIAMHLYAELLCIFPSYRPPFISRSGGGNQNKFTFLFYVKQTTRKTYYDCLACFVFITEISRVHQASVVCVCALAMRVLY